MNSSTVYNFISLYNHKITFIPLNKWFRVLQPAKWRLPAWKCVCMCVFENGDCLYNHVTGWHGYIIIYFYSLFQLPAILNRRIMVVYKQQGINFQRNNTGKHFFGLLKSGYTSDLCGPSPFREVPSELREYDN